MRATHASRTAGWVASARTFGRHLPADARLCDDPYGIRFGETWLRALDGALSAQPLLAQRLWRASGLGTRFVRYMQLRTRFIDDALRAFWASGGRQVVLLGAGYDSRALRLRDALPGLRFFEVDHPATQAVKRARLPELQAADVHFVAWDFLSRPVAQLPRALRAGGHDAAAPTLTIWEGVTMYLDAAAIDATVAAVADYSPAGSSLVFTYMDRSMFGPATGARARAVSLLVSSVGEPFTFGWAAAELPAWLAQRGFSLRRDANARELAEALLPSVHRAGVTRDGRRFALADRA